MEKRVHELLKERGAIGIAALACVIILPCFVGTAVLHVLIMAFFWGYLSSCWNILCGYGGQLSLGHSAFFGTGAYTSTMLYLSFGISPWIGMFMGGVLGLVSGILIGWISFRYRVRGLYFALITLAYAEVFRLVALNLDFIKGPMGILIPLRAGFINFQFFSKIPYYYISLGMLLAVLLITRRMEKIKFGYYLIAVREEEETAECVGVNAYNCKMKAIGLSSFLTAMGGTFHAQYYLYVEPNLDFSVHVVVEMIIRALLGGMGTVLGPLFGSVILSSVDETLRIFSTGPELSSISRMMYGLVLILGVIFLPNGVFALAKKFVGSGERRIIERGGSSKG